uniref:Uncharacterized protein n=1 Tax=Oryza glumipatula TaxID=40148 RepID=A0A0E0AI30_9ORYZ
MGASACERGPSIEMVLSQEEILDRTAVYTNADATNREKELMKACTDPELVAAIVGNAKITTPGLTQLKQKQKQKGEKYLQKKTKNLTKSLPSSATFDDADRMFEVRRTPSLVDMNSVKYCCSTLSAAFSGGPRSSTVTYFDDEGDDISTDMFSSRTKGSLKNMSAPAPRTWIQLLG